MLATEKNRLFGMFEQLLQINKGFLQQQPVWDGNLISKDMTKNLADAGYVERFRGYSFPTRLGQTLIDVFMKGTEK
jgi:hypothetical protein